MSFSMNVLAGVVSGFAVIFIFLLLHHAKIHDGIFFAKQDASDAIQGITKSHEGLIVGGSLLLIGILIGVFI